MTRFVVACLLGLSATSGFAAATAGTRELGAVRFGRDLDAALAASARSGRPVFALFQEIPGCATCTSFGDGPLSHPQVVEAIESEFEAVAIRNNVGGREGEWLRRFGEPAWNNPVVRFVEARGRDVIPRRDGVYSVSGLATRMVSALRAAGRRVPPYLELVASEGGVRHERATFAMHCFWEGQAALGALDGVVDARPVFADGREAVEVTWDPSRLSAEQLVRAADRASCAARVWTNGAAARAVAARVVGQRATGAEARVSPAAASDHLRALERSPLRWLPLTPLQALRVNSALASGGDAEAWLSPRQRALHAGIVAALARDAHAMDGLARPDDEAELAAYMARLTAKLAGGRRGEP